MYKYSHWLAKYRIVGLILLLAMSACADKSPSYYPLKTGYRWQYRAVMTTMDATEKQKYFITNMPKKTIAGEQVFIQRTLTGSEYAFGQDESGVFQLGYTRGDNAEQTFVQDLHYIFHYPLIPGTEWQDSVKTMALRNAGPRGVVITENVPVQVKLVAVNDKVRVAAGTFRNCIRIERTGEVLVPSGKYQYIQQTTVTVKDTAWYAPGVGLVKSVRDEGTGSRLLDHGEYRMELYSFSKK